MRMLSCVLLFVFLGCDPAVDAIQVSNDDVSGEAIDMNALAGKTARNTAVYYYDMADEEPFIECRGELMSFHGVLAIHVTEVETPSGNLLVRGWVEYPGDGWAEGVDSGTIWMRRKGLNPYTETLKGNWYSGEDFWSQSWTIIEWYENEEAGRMKVMWWGGFNMADDGTVRVENDRITCR